jgi:hypothetical protein
MKYENNGKYYSTLFKECLWVPKYLKNWLEKQAQQMIPHQKYSLQTHELRTGPEQKVKNKQVTFKTASQKCCCR